MQHVEVEPSTDKTLTALRAQWLGCTKCVLGEQREATGGTMVFGEGQRRGIMFVAGGPGENEQDQGRPFVGPPGRKVLRPIIEALGIEDVSYITYMVACRSCTQQYDNAGQPLFEQRRGKPAIPKWKDEDPPMPCITACLPRLIEEIYLVDPVVIVALGRAAAETFRGKPIAITMERSYVEEVTIPGATFRPVLTKQKKVWVRGLGPEGKPNAPIERNMVRYLMVPTLHPTHVVGNLADDSPDSPYQHIASDIRLAAKIYERYQLETRGLPPTGSSDTVLTCTKGTEDENY